MKICTQTGGIVDVLGLDAGYAAIAAAGIEAIDWTLDGSLPSKLISEGNVEGNCIFQKEMDEIMAHYEEELSYIRKYGLEISQAHAPFPCHVPGKPLVLDQMIEIYKKMILFCDKIGCRNLIIHGYTFTKASINESAEGMDAVNDKLYTSLIPTLRETNVIVCLENLFSGWASSLISGVCADPREAVEMIDVYNKLAGKECFGFCLDTGHMNLLKYDSRRVIPLLGNRLKALHIHDNSGNIDEHKAPFTGIIDWGLFCDMLKQIGYEGDLSFECFNQTRLGSAWKGLAIPWVNLLGAIGKEFKSRILGE